MDKITPTTAHIAPITQPLPLSQHTSHNSHTSDITHDEFKSKERSSLDLYTHKSLNDNNHDNKNVNHKSASFRVLPPSTTQLPHESPHEQPLTYNISPLPSIQSSMSTSSQQPILTTTQPRQNQNQPPQTTSSLKSTHILPQTQNSLFNTSFINPQKASSQTIPLPFASSNSAIISTPAPTQHSNISQTVPQPSYTQQQQQPQPQHQHQSLPSLFTRPSSPPLNLSMHQPTSGQSSSLLPSVTTPRVVQPISSLSLHPPQHPQQQQQQQQQPHQLSNQFPLFSLPPYQPIQLPLSNLPTPTAAAGHQQPPHPSILTTSAQQSTKLTSPFLHSIPLPPLPPTYKDSSHHNIFGGVGSGVGSGDISHPTISANTSISNQSSLAMGLNINATSTTLPDFNPHAPHLFMPPYNPATISSSSSASMQSLSTPFHPVNTNLTQQQQQQPHFKSPLVLPRNTINTSTATYPTSTTTINTLNTNLQQFQQQQLQQQHLQQQQQQTQKRKQPPALDTTSSSNISQNQPYYHANFRGDNIMGSEEDHHRQLINNNSNNNSSTTNIINILNKNQNIHQIGPNTMNTSTISGKLQPQFDKKIHENNIVHDDTHSGSCSCTSCSCTSSTSSSNNNSPKINEKRSFDQHIDTSGTHLTLGTIPTTINVDIIDTDGTKTKMKRRITNPQNKNKRILQTIDDSYPSRSSQQSQKQHKGNGNDEMKYNDGDMVENGDKNVKLSQEHIQQHDGDQDIDEHYDTMSTRRSTRRKLSTPQQDGPISMVTTRSRGKTATVDTTPVLTKVSTRPHHHKTAEYDEKDDKDKKSSHLERDMASHTTSTATGSLSHPHLTKKSSSTSSTSSIDGILKSHEPKLIQTVSINEDIEDLNNDNILTTRNLPHLSTSVHETMDGRISTIANVPHLTNIAGSGVIPSVHMGTGIGTTGSSVVGSSSTLGHKMGTSGIGPPPFYHPYQPQFMQQLQHTQPPHLFSQGQPQQLQQQQQYPYPLQQQQQQHQQHQQMIQSQLFNYTNPINNPTLFSTLPLHQNITNTPVPVGFTSLPPKNTITPGTRRSFGRTTASTPIPFTISDATQQQQQQQHLSRPSTATTSLSLSLSSSNSPSLYHTAIQYPLQQSHPPIQQQHQLLSIHQNVPIHMTPPPYMALNPRSSSIASQPASTSTSSSSSRQQQFYQQQQSPPVSTASSNNNSRDGSPNVQQQQQQHQHRKREQLPPRQLHHKPPPHTTQSTQSKSTTTSGTKSSSSRSASTSTSTSASTRAKTSGALASTSTSTTSTTTTSTGTGGGSNKNSPYISHLPTYQLNEAIAYAKDKLDKKNKRWTMSTAGERALSEHAVEVLHTYLLDHFSNPYPTSKEMATLMRDTGLNQQQINYWLINSRSRILKPALEFVKNKYQHKQPPSSQKTST